MDQTTSNVARSKNLSWDEKKIICEQWKASGKNKSAFCKERGIPLQTLWSWCDRLWPTSKKKTRLAKVLVVNKDKVTSNKEVSLQTTIEIILPNQSILRLKLPTENIGLFIKDICHANPIIR